MEPKVDLGVSANWKFRCFVMLHDYSVVSGVRVSGFWLVHYPLVITTTSRTVDLLFGGGRVDPCG